MTSSCLLCNGSESFYLVFSRSGLSHSQFLLDCVRNLRSNSSRSRVTDPIWNLDSLPGANFPRLTSSCVFKTNLPFHLGIHQHKFQDSHTSSASSISGRCLMLCRCHLFDVTTAQSLLLCLLVSLLLSDFLRLLCVLCIPLLIFSVLVLLPFLPRRRYIHVCPLRLPLFFRLRKKMQPHSRL